MSVKLKSLVIRGSSSILHGQFHKMTAKILNMSSINNENRALYLLQRAEKTIQFVIATNICVIHFVTDFYFDLVRHETDNY